MVIPILETIPFSFTKKMLSSSKKMFSSLAIWNPNFPRITHCKASYKDAKNHSNQTITRRSANFQPSIWTYDYIQSLSSEYKA
jgi:hypothetical protein